MGHYATFCLIFVTGRRLLETGMKIDCKYEKEVLWNGVLIVRCLVLEVLFTLFVHLEGQKHTTSLLSDHGYLGFKYCNILYTNWQCHKASKATMLIFMKWNIMF